MIFASLRASHFLFDGAWNKIMHSPVSWHDRTPVCTPHHRQWPLIIPLYQAGRIISRMSKGTQYFDHPFHPWWTGTDIEMIDDKLATELNEFLS